MGTADATNKWSTAKGLRLPVFGCVLWALRNENEQRRLRHLFRRLHIIMFSLDLEATLIAIFPASCKPTFVDH